MKIAIAGAGAMGSRFAFMLHRAGNEVILIDGWEEHVQAINKNGLCGTFNGEEFKALIPAYSQKHLDKNLSVDLIILFTKALQLETMLQDIQSLIHKNTKILCLLNGIGHEDLIKNYVALENIFIGNTMWTASLEGPGRVKLFGSGSVELQNLGAGQEEAAKKIAKVLSEADLKASYSEHILYSIYKKACVNGTMNGLCTILDCNMADFGATSPAKQIITTIVEEFCAVAKKEGVTLEVAEIVEFISKCYNRETIGNHHPSMHQDLIKNKRLTEIDYINGAIVRKGELYGIATPYCALITQLIHCKEQLLGAK